MKGLKLSRSGRSMLLSLAIILLAVLLVIGAGMIPGRYTRFDMSSQRLYTLSEESVSLLGELQTEVELVLLTTEGGEDLTLQNLLQRYSDMSAHVTLRSLDPSKNRDFVSLHAPNLRYSNSVVVLSGERSCLVDYSELFENDYSVFYESGYTADIATTFCAEKVITGAIRYVTEDKLPKLYVLSGHGEATLGDGVSRSLRVSGIRTQQLDLSTTEAVPGDCAALLIHAPSYDISSDEREKLADYLNAGGQLLLITAYSGEELPELHALMEPFGCVLGNGLVVEQDREHYIYGYYDCIIPNIEEHELTEDMLATEAYIVMPGSQAILNDERAEVNVTPLLTTSAAAYATTDLSSIGIKEGDISGPLTIAALIEHGESRIIWFGSGFMLDESYMESFGSANAELFSSGVRYLCGGETLEIPGSSMAADTLTLSTAQSMVAGLFMTLVLPLAFVVTGGAILLRRRRRA